MKDLKILDCTFRDGGYYTNWDFSSDLVDCYLEATNILPIDYLEVGYRNLPSKEYLGKFGYTPISILEHLREVSKKKLVVMLNEKNLKVSDLDKLLKPILGLVDMIRIAIDPQNFDRAVILAEAIKKMNFEVGFNTMYMSKWHEYEGFISKLNRINGIADLFCMVDSFGGVTPKDVKKVFHIIQSNTVCPIGFHGHNNLQLALINTLTAIDCGVDYVDATILGMGRGAGNLNMELLLTYLNKRNLEVDFNVLGELITVFQPLYEKCKWGTNLPYMLSGANSIPQKDVMEWVSNRAYSFNSIVRALDNKRVKIADNAHFPLLQFQQASQVLIIGGGSSSIEHLDAIKEYIKINPKIALVFATSRYVAYYNDLPNKKYYCLTGNEAKRLLKNISGKEFNGICILAPYPRVMGTEVPKYAEEYTFELSEITFTHSYLDSCTTIALQTAIELGATEINIVGYDGYKGEVLSEKEMALTNENRTLFYEFSNSQKCILQSLTSTLYKELKVKSIYQCI